MLENPSQDLPKASQNPPKILPKPSKIEPKPSPGASKSTSDVHSKYKREKSRAQNDPRGPKRLQIPPKPSPKPSQMEPKTLPKSIVKGFFPLYFPVPNLHRFFVDVYVIFMIFLKARTFKFIAPVEAKRYFLQDRSFEQHRQKSSKNRPKTHSKST